VTPGRFLIACLAAVAAGCVSVGTLEMREEVDPAATRNIRGAYRNNADTRSKGEFVASPTLAEALDLPARDADWAYVWRLSDDEVLVRFVTAGATVYQRIYRRGVDLQVMPDQKLVFAITTRCGGRDSPGFACGGGTVTLFVSPTHQLVAIESGGGAGVLGVVPMAIYSRQFAIYRPVLDAPPIR